MIVDVAWIAARNENERREVFAAFGLEGFNSGRELHAVKCLPEEKKRRDPIYAHDPPEVIAICENCPIPDGCRPASRACPLYGQSEKAKRKRRKAGKL